MTDPAIVVGVDGSDQALDAVRWAAAEAAPRALPLQLVSAVDPAIAVATAGPPVVEEAVEAIEQIAKADLEKAAQLARVTADITVRTEYFPSPAIPVLVEQSKHARLLALGASGRGGYAGMLLGSTAVSVVARSECPVVVVRPAAEPAGPVVVGVDGNETSLGALAAAFDEAAWRRAPLVAVHSWFDSDYLLATQYGLVEGEPEEEEQAQVLAESLAGWQEKYPDVTVQRVVVRDHPRHQLLEWSHKAQLVVVGSRGRGGFKGLVLGSTSQALIQHASCPVMVVRG
ncbi:universal stress protein [Amycolatopsis carbonis]|uniref:Universal stress protein n=1 Tax=Amycolatopsis carbonis TaxID=715471 RepID=A0A9Y2IB42_9PSEU|nr:universal stress protein [Amycolatopsis sp. 2-15]WIX76649.1 universal stress protein [Amycolatopsis sp. 2-15]